MTRENNDNPSDEAECIRVKRDNMWFGANGMNWFQNEYSIQSNYLAKWICFGFRVHADKTITIKIWAKFYHFEIYLQKIFKVESTNSLVRWYCWQLCNIDMDCVRGIRIYLAQLEFKTIETVLTHKWRS